MRKAIVNLLRVIPSGTTLFAAVARAFFVLATGISILISVPVSSASAVPGELPDRTSFGAGQLNIPRGVALDEATGDVYVVDQNNQRVDEFEPWGQFILSFGKEVNETTKANVCTAESEDICKAGVGGDGASQFNIPQGIAVDNSSDSSKGDVYVVDKANIRIEKFGSEGKFILAFGKEVNETTKANVCTETEVEGGDKCGPGREGTGESEFKWPNAGSFIAIGSTGTVYVGDENRVQEFKPTGAYEGEVQIAGVGQIQALAVDSSGNLYIASGTSNVRKYSATGERLAEFVNSSGFDARAVAVNTAGDVYTGNEFRENEQFHITEYGQAGEDLAESSTFEGESVVSSGIAASAGGTVYLSNFNGDVIMFGEFPAFGECPFCEPSVKEKSEFASDLGVTSAVVSAEINPDLLPTHYYVQYVEAAAYEEAVSKGAANPYEKGGVVPTPPATVALGGGEVDADEPADVTLQGLSPGRTYHYRFVAESRSSGPIYGEDESFTTFPATVFSGLPDGRVYEQVSEEQKNGNEAGVTSGGSPEAGYGVASASGERFAYSQAGPSGRTSSGTDFYSVASRNPDAGWESAAALPSGYGPNAANLLSELPHTLLASAELTHFVFRAEGSFVKENPVTENLQTSTGLYRTIGDSVEPEWLSEPAEWQSSGHHPPFEVRPDPGAENESLKDTLERPPAGGSPDLSTVYFPYLGALVKEDASRAPNLVTTSNGEVTGPYGFYEYKEGVLRSAAELPSGVPGAPYSPYGALPAVEGLKDEKTSVFHALNNVVSRDGSKAFFVSPDPESTGNGSETFAEEAGTPTELYVRETTGQGAGEAHRPVLVSRNELNDRAEAEKGAGTGKAAYTETAVVPGTMYAAPDGSRVFFQSLDKLAKSAPVAGEKEPEGMGPWTYEFNLETEKLTYLPGVAGILASSSNGSSFIFENSATGKIELWSGGPAPSEIAGFSTPASPGFEARASANGAAFILATNAVLTGALDAEGAGPANNQGEQRQVYRYEPSSGSLLCLSCAPMGIVQSPASSFNTEGGAGRVIADEGGRVFFTTAEKLLSRDVNGVDDVYEWEREGLGSCPQGQKAGCVYLISSGTSPGPSFYLDNDESGENVFFATSQGLVAGDTDESYDVYDARVGGGFPQASPSSGCAADCQGPPVPFSFSSPLTAVASPSGNIAPPAESKVPIESHAKRKPLTRAQKLAKALNACGKDKSKRKKAVCEAQARKRYGDLSRAEKAASDGRNG